MKSTYSLAILVALAAAQTLADLPQCSVQCITDAMTLVRCATTDFKCACEKADELFVGSCIIKDCTKLDTNTAFQVITDLCKSFGGTMDSAEDSPAHMAVADAGYAVASSTTLNSLPAFTSGYAINSSSQISDATGASSVAPECPNGTTGACSYVFTITTTRIVSLITHHSSHTVSVISSIPAASNSVAGSVNLSSFAPPPYPTGSSKPTATVPTDMGSYKPSTPEFTDTAAAVRVPAVVAGVLGLAILVL
ncbi:hypothetical protein EJ02DRAFT_464574 [Clathrospora elynae]|uniref:CFEM domain-containing protein n=1 Tax=Clathrospora elynae TaxID=706981 RepID=A0A6A5SVV1_9PLEO|nr:hypothetical protein EJ02DRAFT_464574 [Clathrospora elynae]